MKFITDYKIELSVIVDADNIEYARIFCNRLEQDLGIKIMSNPTLTTNRRTEGTRMNTNKNARKRWSANEQN